MNEKLVQSCGRLGAHEEHQWLSRRYLWCPGDGVPGTTAQPKPDSDDDPDGHVQQ